MLKQRLKRWTRGSWSRGAAVALIVFPCEECLFECNTLPPLECASSTEGPESTTTPVGTTVGSWGTETTTTTTGDYDDLPCEPAPVEVPCCGPGEAALGCDEMIACTGEASESWPRRYGDLGDQYVFSLALDRGHDGIVLGGRANGRLLGEELNLQTTQFRQYVARIGRTTDCGDGASWLATFGSVEEENYKLDSNIRVTTDSDGMTYVALAIEGGELNGETLDVGLLVAALNREGDVQEHRFFPLDGDGVAVSSIVTDDSSLFIGGWHLGTLSYGDEAESSGLEPGASQGFVVRLNATDLEYSETIGIETTANIQIRALDVHGEQLFVAGRFFAQDPPQNVQLSIDGCEPALSGLDEQGFVARLDKGTLHCFDARSIEVESGAVTPTTIARADGSAAFVIVGTYRGMLTYGGVPIEPTDTNDCFVLSLDGDLTLATLDGLHSADYLDCQGAAFDKSGNLIIGGSGSDPVESTIDLMPDEIVLEDKDSFVVKWRPDGSRVWIEVMESHEPASQSEDNDVELRGIAVDRANRSVIVGNARGSATTYGETLASSPEEPELPERFGPNEDVFVVVAEP